MEQEAQSVWGQAQEASQINAELLEAVREDDPRRVRRALEEGAGAWLGFGESLSGDPSENPVLNALLSPVGQRCLEAFDQFFGDVREWSHGGWSPAHWAMAQRSEWALRWALEGGVSGASPQERLFKREEGQQWGGGLNVQRSPLAVCSMVGDPDWLEAALGIAREAGCPMEELARADRRSEPSALAAALFGLSEKAAAGASKEEMEDQMRCVELLAKAGFPVDGRAPTGKLCVALALASPSKKGRKSMGKAAQVASKLGSGAVGGALVGPWEAAGRALDPSWARALKLCCVPQSAEDCFGVGAGHALLKELAEGDGSWWAAGPALARSLGEMIEASFAECSIGVDARPMLGLEYECAQWLSDNAAGLGLERSAYQEKIALALAAGTAGPPKGPAARL